MTPNPSSPADATFLTLVKALKSSDQPENVQQALYDWLGGLAEPVMPEEVDQLLHQGPNQAFSALARKVKANVAIHDVLKRALNYIFSQAGRSEFVVNRLLH